MKERPILFSGAMVRALLDGSKTQTRRIVKPQPVFGDVGGMFASWMFKKKHAPGHWLYPNARSIVISECPYGQCGDLFWVRESLAPTRDKQGHIADWHYSADGTKVRRMPGLNPDFSDAMAFAHLVRPSSVPSIHMPRWASRITLEVTGVRVERLQDISETDALAEGVRQHDQKNGWVNECTLADGKRHFDASAYGMFQQLWADINGNESWNSNPWVWVVEFKRVTP